MLYRFEDYELDLARFELRRGGQEILLEPQVFEVLAYLVQHHDRMVSKDELIEHIWPEGYVTEAALSSRMMAARKAVGDNGRDQRVIRTVHGRGFRFVAPLQVVTPTPAPVGEGADESAPSEVRIQYAKTADGMSIAYAVTGTGPPLVRALAWFTHLELEWRWPPARRLWERLAKHHTLIRYDARGMGLSEPCDEITHQTRLLDLEAVIAASSMERVDLLGISSGVTESVQYAASHPERVGRLIAYGGGPPPRDPEERQHWEALQKLRRDTIREGWGLPVSAYQELFAHLFLGSVATPENIGYFLEMQRASTTPERAAKYLEAGLPTGMEEAAAAIRVPTLVVHRRGDQLVPFSRSRRLAELVPGAELRVLEGDNHWLLLDDPGAPEFVEAIDQFTGVV